MFFDPCQKCVVIHAAIGNRKADVHNLFVGAIQTDAVDLQECRRYYMHGMPLKEMDKNIDTVCSLCWGHEKTGLVERVKVGIRLKQVLTSK